MAVAKLDLRDLDFDLDGLLNAGGKVYSYQATTTTPLATYADYTGAVPNPNPIVLDSSGQGHIWLTKGVAYKFVYKTADDVTIDTEDGISIDDTAAMIAAALGYDPAAPPTESLVVACSDETTALTTGVKVTFRIPYAFTLTGVKASLTTAQTSGSIFTVDIKESGVSVLSTLITIDNTERTSVTAATAAVISDSSIANDAEMTLSITQIGDGTAKGLKVTLVGQRTA